MHYNPSARNTCQQLASVDGTAPPSSGSDLPRRVPPGLADTQPSSRHKGTYGPNSWNDCTSAQPGGVFSAVRPSLFAALPSTMCRGPSHSPGAAHFLSFAPHGALPAPWPVRPETQFLPTRERSSTRGLVSPSLLGGRAPSAFRRFSPDAALR